MSEQPPEWGPPPGSFGPPPGVPGPPTHAGRPAVPFSQRLGPRLLRRPEPRLGVSLAAAGAALVLLGILVWSVGYIVDGFDISSTDTGVSINGEDRKYLGAGLSAVAVALGYLLLIRFRRGPLATAGAVLGAFGVPLLVGFLTFSLSGAAGGDTIDAIYIVSIVVWLASYLLVPGARGRGFYVGLAAQGFASYLVLKVAGSGTVVSIGVSVAGNGNVGSPDTSALIAVGLILGLGYYALAALLDRRGRHGAAVGLVYAAFFTTLTGVIAAIPSFEQVGTGLLLIALGLGLAWYGGRYGRRFTTWAWTVGFVIGVGAIAEKVLPHSYTGAGVLLIAIGALVMVVAAVAGRREAPDIAEDLVPAMGMP